MPAPTPGRPRGHPCPRAGASRRPESSGASTRARARGRVGVPAWKQGGQEQSVGGQDCTVAKIGEIVRTGLKKLATK